MDQSSCTTRFMNLTLTERKNDRSFVQPVSNLSFTDQSSMLFSENSRHSKTIKLPNSRELIQSATKLLQNGCGTKEEVLDKAVQICPQASKECNPAFFKTLEQGFSKYLVVLP